MLNNISAMLHEPAHGGPFRKGKCTASFISMRNFDVRQLDYNLNVLIFTREMID